MSLTKLRNLPIYLLLEKAYGHEFDHDTPLTTPTAGFCKKCGAFVMDVYEKVFVKKENPGRCCQAVDTAPLWVGSGI